MLFHILVSVAAILTSRGDDNPQVVAPAGTFQGSVMTSASGRPFVAFRGIPYAQPPIGNLRFAKPQRIQESMTTVQDATKAGPVCIQPSNAGFGHKGQEDCLYLNVFMPERHQQFKPADDQLYKVFVFIHGGSLVMGSANYNTPGDLVTQGEIIVVTINYRLRWLGFLRGNTTELPGNLGLWDQVMALTWVKENIRAFGGDPDDVTIGGQSSGSECVSLLSITPHAKELFTKGIMMSQAWKHSQIPRDGFRTNLPLAARELNCWPAGVETPSHQQTSHANFSSEETRQVLECLRELPEEKFHTHNNYPDVRQLVRYDEDYFPFPVGDMVDDTSYLNTVGFFSKSFLLSLMSNEGVFFKTGSLGMKEGEVGPQSVTRMLGIPPGASDKLLTWYSQPDHHNYNPIYDIFADKIYTAMMFKFLETHAKKELKPTDTTESRGNAYFMYFDHRPTYLPPSHEGSPHGLDLTYMFDTHPREYLREFNHPFTDRNFTEEDVKLKEKYIRLISDFVKYGNPATSMAAGQSQEKWLPFEEDSESYLSFSPQPTVKYFPLLARRHLWREIVPRWISEEQKVPVKDEF